MRRAALLIAALVLPVLPAAPAYAATNTICVNTTDPACAGPPLATLGEGLTAANNDGVDSVVLLGPGEYTEPGRMLIGSAGNALTVRGAGPSTVFSMPAPSPSAYLYVEEATLEDLTIKMKGGAASSGNTGLILNGGATVDGVTVDGLGDPGSSVPATTNSTGVQVGSTDNVVMGSQILMPLSDPNSQGMRGDGVATVSDTTLTGAYGSRLGSSPASTISRVTVRASVMAVWVEVGAIAIDNSVVDLGTSDAAGLVAANFNNSDLPKTISAEHVTIVGGGDGARGVWAWAQAPGAAQTSTVTLTNSIVRGPLTSLEARASNVGQPTMSTATINVSYSDYEGTASVGGPNGTAVITSGAAGNVTFVDPLFVDAAAGDYRLSSGSPLVDKGDPAAVGPALDRAGNARLTDGDGNGVAVRDMGAYERPAPVPPTVPSPTTPADATAPGTAITKKPAKKITSKKARFAFTATEAGASFQCKRDAKDYVPCGSPFTWKVKLGKHVLLVRAVDAAGNVDPTPARYRFTRVPKS